MSDPLNRERRRELRQPGGDEWAPTDELAAGALAHDNATGLSDRESQGDKERSRATVPASQISPSDWKGIFWRIYQNVSNHRIVAIAAGVTFYALLAIFPGIATLVALYGLVADPSTISKHLTSLSSFLPGGAIDVIGGQLQRLSDQGNTKLGLTLLLSLAISIWSANAGVKALFDAVNIVYGELEKRSFIKLNAVSLAFTCGALLFILLTLMAIVVLPLIIDYLGLAKAAQWAVTLGKWPVLLLAIALTVAMMYRYGPSREMPQWRWLTWGSGFAAIGWVVVSILFSWYAAHFGSYNKTYGSLGAVIAFMTWMWLSSIVILLGAELDAVMERHTASDAKRSPRASNHPEQRPTAPHQGR
jgi:membrane protein